MNVFCKNCDVVIGKIDDSKIPDKGAVATCPKCKTKISLKKISGNQASIAHKKKSSLAEKKQTNSSSKNTEEKIKGKKCKNCGYIRTNEDIAPEIECPSCGAIYAKMEKPPEKGDKEQIDKSKEKPGLSENSRIREETTRKSNFKKPIIIVPVILIIIGVYFFEAHEKPEEKNEIAQLGEVKKEKIVDNRLAMNTEALEALLEEIRGAASSYGVTINMKDLEDHYTSGQNATRWLFYIDSKGPVSVREIQKISDEEKNASEPVKCENFQGGMNYLDKFPRDNSAYFKCFRKEKVSQAVKSTRHVIAFGSVTSVKWLSHQWDSTEKKWATYTREDYLKNARWLLAEEEGRLNKHYQTEQERLEKRIDRIDKDRSKSFAKIRSIQSDIDNEEDVGKEKIKRRT